MTRDHDPHDAAPGGTHDGAKAPAQAQTPDERLRALLGDGLDGVEVTPEEKAAAKLTAHGGDAPRSDPPRRCAGGESGISRPG